MNVKTTTRVRPLATGPLLITGIAALLAGCTSDDDSNPGPRVSSPAAGAIITGNFDLRWASIGGGDMVDIDLSDDGGATYANNLAMDTDNDGIETIDSTAFVDGANYRLRVMTDTVTAESGVFTIDNTAPTVALLGPNGGDFVGTSGTITWQTTDANPGTVDIVASSDSGANFDIVVATGVTDTGTFNWNVSGLTEAATYRVRVTPTDLAGLTGAPATSSGDFTLDLTAPVVTLTAPNGGESLTGITNVTWTTTDANPGTVALSASIDSGGAFGTVIATDAPDNGTFAWSTATLPDTMTARLQIVATDLAGNVSAPDASDADFSAENLRLINVGHYEDANGSGTIDGGDTVLIRFDKSINISGTAASDFELPVAGDTLGTGPMFTANAPLQDPDTILITLGANPVLRTRGAFSADDVDAASPSGINIAAGIAAGSITANGGALNAAPVGEAVDFLPRAVDLTPLAMTSLVSAKGDAGDLDGDGDLDIVIAVTGADDSVVLTNDGSNGWTQTQTLAAGDARDVEIVDVDGDGDLDVVFAAIGANTVWTNNGTGTLADSGQVLGANSSLGLAAGDLDGDGAADLYFANGVAGGGAVANTVYLNNGSGVFADTGQALGGGTSTSVALGDMDADGDLDAFVGNLAGADSQQYLNDGTGVFTAGASITQTNAQDVLLVDIDVDNDLDVIMAVNGQNQIRLNVGDGTLEPQSTLFDNNDNRAIAALDLDGDGDLDLVTAKNQDSGKYFLNDGAGNFTIDTVDSEPAPHTGIVTGDFDGDSDVDFFMIVEFNGGFGGINGQHIPYRNSSAGGQPGATYAAGPIALAAAAGQSGAASVGDVDGDGDDDVIVPDVAGTTGVLLNERDGSFSAGATFGAADARGGDLFDADGDGDLDYLQRSGDVGTANDALWLNDGDGAFTSSGLTLGVDTFAAGDLDGDLDPDLIVVSPTAIETWDGDGAGGFAASGQTVAAAGSVLAAVGDIDGDGFADVVVASATTLDAYANDGSGTFAQSDTEALADVTALTLADLDQDGDLDILFASSAVGTDLRWLEGAGDGTFAAAQSAAAVQNAFAQLTTVDVNEDGALDLVAVDDAGELVFVLDGNGDGTFNANAGEAAAGVSSIAVIDADLDGDPDLYRSRGNGPAPANLADELAVLD